MHDSGTLMKAMTKLGDLQMNVEWPLAITST